MDVAKYRLRKIDWFTPRTAVLMEKYALTEETVVSLHDVFSQTDYKVLFFWGGGECACCRDVAYPTWPAAMS